MHIPRPRLIVQATAIAVLASTALVPTLRHAGASSLPAVTDVKIAAKDFALTAPSRIPAGLVRFAVTGTTDPFGGMAIVAGINPGVSHAQVASALNKGDVTGIVKIVTPLGGPASVADPKVNGSVTLSLKAGDYVLFDITQDDKGKSHALYKFLEIAPAAGQAGEPASTATIYELDMKFRLPATLPTGPVTFKIVNKGPSIHETILMKLHAGVTVKQLKDYINQPNPSGPPPGDPAGMAAVMASGHTQWATTNLSSGNYVLVCFMLDKHGLPHVADGMIKGFTVR